MIPTIIVLIATWTVLAFVIALAVAISMIMTGRQVIDQYRQTLTLLLLEHRMQGVANTDALTGLANRRAFLAMMQDDLDRGERFGVAILDLDSFKPINDRLGHFAGDKLLQVVASRLQDSCAEGDYVGRFGGDEFALLFRNLASSADIPARAASVMEALCRPAEIVGETIEVSACLGYAGYPNDATKMLDLLGEADRALYEAKRRIKVILSDVDDKQRHIAGSMPTMDRRQPAVKLRRPGTANARSPREGLESITTK